MKQTNWEKKLIEMGAQIVTWDPEEIMDYLLEVFNREHAELLLLAAKDDTKRRELSIVLDFDGMFTGLKINISAMANYNKKLRKFTHITYGDLRNYAVMFSITSRCYYSCYDYYMQWKSIFPFGASTKKMAAYLLNN